MDLRIRQMTHEDIPAGMQLKSFAGWNQTEADWRVFLDANPAGCFAAVCGGRVVGTTTVIRYGPALAWIGMVLVHPEYRGQGIATTLMRKALDHLTDCPTVKLDATAAGKPVYEKLGFAEEGIIRRLTTPNLPPVEGSDDEIARAERADFEMIARMDRPCFGGDRTFLLNALRESAADLAWHLTSGGQTTGYCVGRRGSSFVQIGPIVAETVDDATRLARAALRPLTEAAVVLDVPAIHAELLRWLQSVGFSIQREFVRMVRGERDRSPTMERQFAVCGPEFG